MPARQYFYGIKVHAIFSTTGVPVCFEFSPGSIHDIVAFRGMDMTALEEGVLYGDSAYTDYALEDQLSSDGLKMVIARKENSKRPHSPEIFWKLSRKRKTIETAFSLLMRLFPRNIHAVSLKGIMLKITLFFAAFTVTLF